MVGKVYCYPYFREGQNQDMFPLNLALIKYELKMRSTMNRKKTICILHTAWRACICSPSLWKNKSFTSHLEIPNKKKMEKYFAG